MVKLDKNWLTTGLLDFEYKKYILLDYLQKVGVKFDSLKLYPYFSDLIAHYEKLKDLNSEMEKLEEVFPRDIIDVDMENIELIYEEIKMDTPEINFIKEMLGFSIPEIKKTLEIGKSIFYEVEKCIEINTIGIIPTDILKGYFIIDNKSINVYEYDLIAYKTSINQAILKTNLIRKYPKGYNITYDNIRLDLIESKDIGNALFFVITTPFNYPMNETFLPIVKRLLIKKLLQH